MGSRPSAPRTAKGPGDPQPGTLWPRAPPRSALLPRLSRSLRLGRDLRLLRELVGVFGPPFFLPESAGGKLGPAAGEQAGGRASER